VTRLSLDILSFTYDVLGRQTNVTAPFSATDVMATSTSYTIGTNGLGDGRAWMVTTVTDPDENLRLSYADSRGNRVGVQELNTIGTATSLGTLTTKYAYDPIDELLSVTDAKGNVTSSGMTRSGRW
jgi:YD repeat-containing protein